MKAASSPPTLRTTASGLPGRAVLFRLRLLIAVCALACTWALAQPPQRLIDYAAAVGVHPEDPRIPNVGTPRFGGVFTYAHNETLASLDAHKSAAATTVTLNIHFAEGLFALDATGTSRPDLVDSYTVSDDGTVYTFSLRQGVPFHNGEILGAADVVASLQRWFGGTLGSQAARYISELNVVDQYTVEIVLTEPYPFIIYQLTVPQTSGAYIYPRSQIEAVGDGTIDTPIATGPYYVADVREGDYVRLVRFDDYVGRVEPPSGFAGGRVAYLDEIIIQTVPDAIVRMAGVETGQFDKAHNATNDMYSLYANRPDIRPRIAMGSFATAQFNKRQGPMTDQRLRLAFNYAIDVRQIVAAAGPPEFTEANSSLAPRDDPWYTPVGEDVYLGYDPEYARALLAEAGYNGEPIRWLVDPSVASYYTSAQVAVPMLEAVGFNIQLVPMDAATLRTMRNDETAYEVYAQGLGWRADPAALTNLSDSNPGWWVTEEKTRILEAMRLEQDFDKRYALWEELHAHMYDYMPAVKFETFGSLSLERAAYSGAFQAWAYVDFINTWLND
ncbi:MAG: hypothetical protein KF875_06235 [Trueperaceae bacterium]|nr:hypothetical protein [Trueperaceae bacterium]MCW5819350.1 hypothetical protein [Trueperaceae bacterium]